MNDITTLYNSLLLDIADNGASADRNIVAFSGGVDSTLVAHAVYKVYPDNSEAFMALSPSVSLLMRASAEALARHIGIPLRTVRTEEYLDPQYIANEGMSCYVCKNRIYDAMLVISAEHAEESVCLYNGTNADDITDLTRVGLRAAREHQVLSPLSRFNKNQIRLMSRHAGLPNWNDAASPCLRSRLHFGVPATEEHLRRIETAEEAVRRTYRIPTACNLRVRHLLDESAMIEVDEEYLDNIDLGQCRPSLMRLGFTDVRKRPFRSGSVSGVVDDADH